jgi:hypothetical protein
VIAAALSWFDEQPEALRRCVRSLAGVADVVVALDGRWSLFPGSRNVSPLEQAEAIHEAATEIGIPVIDESCRSSSPWESQMEKRTALMRFAAEREPWTLVIDADEYITDCATVALRDELLDAALDVAEVAIIPAGPGIFDTRAKPRRRLYRSSVRVTVERGHNGYRTMDGRWLNGDAAHVDVEPAVDLSALLALVHDHDARQDSRERAADSYYRLRAKVEGEWAVA